MRYRTVTDYRGWLTTWRSPVMPPQYFPSICSWILSMRYLVWNYRMWTWLTLFLTHAQISISGKGAPAQESWTGTWLVSPAWGHEKKFGRPQFGQKFNYLSTEKCTSKSIRHWNTRIWPKYWRKIPDANYRAWEYLANHCSKEGCHDCGVKYTWDWKTSR